MITRTDVSEALAMLTGNASDKTPDAGELTIQAWCDYFRTHPTWTGDDLVAAVTMYCQQPRERLVQPADLGAVISALLRDRYERIDPDQLPYPGDAKTAPPDPQAGYARGVYVEHDPAGWPYANAATREERANADTELRARVKARIKATPRGETPPTEAEAETAIRLEDRERAEKFLRRRDLAGLIEGLGAQPGSTRRPAPAFSEPLRPTNP